MDQFSVFLAFYGLLLGLAATEILSSLGIIVRTRPLRTLEVQSSLLALITFLAICGAFIDAWNLRTSLSMDFISLAPAIGVAVSYYIAAVVVLPRESAGLDDVATYFSERKRFVAGALIASELFYKILILPIFRAELMDAPKVFWVWTLPLNAGFLIGFGAIYFAKSRKANLTAMAFQLCLITITYLPNNMVGTAIRSAFGYPPK